MSPASGSPPILLDLGYVAAALARALARARERASEGPDAGARERAAEKVRKWRHVFEGIVSGELSVGSRTPVTNAPAWVTLEVAPGGFATGSFLAGGELQAHEKELLGRIGAGSISPPRAALNLFFLTDEGRGELVEALRTGCYRVHVPEEGALLTVAWLLARGEAAAAETVLEAIAPFFDRLRFFPVPHPRPLVAGTAVRLQPIGKTSSDLRAAVQQPQVLAMNEALSVWAPLYDRAAALFLETVEGALPSLRVDEGGNLVRRPDGQPWVEGGWPCRVTPAGWADRARELLGEYAARRRSHALSGKPEKPKENFARLRAYLDRAAASPATLTGKDVGMIRKILASYVTRTGSPTSQRRALRRVREAEVASRPTHGAFRSLVLERIAPLPADAGLPSVEAVSGPVTADEAARTGLRVGAHLPRSIVQKVRRSLEAPIEILVGARIVPSLESLAVVLPQMASHIRAAGIADPELGRVYAAVDAAFRRRRSLLLLDLASQVRLGELPWIAAIEPFRRRDTTNEDASKECLRQVALLAITAYPETVLPNKLLGELRALAGTAKLDLPFVDELASDIFMGEFSEKFLRAARIAAGLLRGTLYERYYGVDFDEILAIKDVPPHPDRSSGAAKPSAFAMMCHRLAGADLRATWSVAANGTILEQAQILTTHNLAALFATLDLAGELRSRLLDLAKSCFTWVCRQQQPTRGAKASQLRTAKNMAYAWRQMLFFLSVDPAGVPASSVSSVFLPWAEEHLQAQGADFRARFAPALRGLRVVAGGGSFDGSGRTPDGGRRFLGWTTERPWVLGALGVLGASPSPVPQPD